MQGGRICHGLAGLQDMIDVSDRLALIFLAGTPSVALMLRLSYPAGMYTRLFGPALGAFTLAPIDC